MPTPSLIHLLPPLVSELKRQMSHFYAMHGILYLLAGCYRNIEKHNAMRNGNINKHMLNWHDVKIETRHDVMSDEYAGDYIDNMDV